MAITAVLSLMACTSNVSDIIAKAQQGDAEAQLQYARLLKTTGNGVEQDWPKAIEMLHLSANSGNADAQWELGLMYEFSDKMKQDHGKALELYQSSADAGSPIGLYLVAHCYQHGIAVNEDHNVSDSLYTKAFKELLALAPEEDIYVLNFLGSAYFWADGVKQDRKKAFKYYLISAEKGNPETQYKVGNCYETGQGTEKDMQKALFWYEKSASQGYPDAVNALQKVF